MHSNTGIYPYDLHHPAGVVSKQTLRAATEVFTWNHKEKRKCELSETIQRQTWPCFKLLMFIKYMHSGHINNNGLSKKSRPFSKQEATSISSEHHHIKIKHSSLKKSQAPLVFHDRNCSAGYTNKWSASPAPTWGDLRKCLFSASSFVDPDL